MHVTWYDKLSVASCLFASLEWLVVGYYMYIEASRPRAEGDKARLLSPLFNVSSVKSPKGPVPYCVSFYYHMKGKHIGECHAHTHTNPSLWYESIHSGTVLHCADKAKPHCYQYISVRDWSQGLTRVWRACQTQPCRFCVCKQKRCGMEGRMLKMVCLHVSAVPRCGCTCVFSGWMKGAVAVWFIAGIRNNQSFGRAVHHNMLCQAARMHISPSVHSCKQVSAHRSKE